MGIYSGIRSGLTRGILQGLNPSSGGIVTIADLAAASDPGQELADIMSVVKPTLMWYGGDASGATELVSGSANLSDSDAPAKQQTDHNFAAGTLTTEMLGANDRLVASTSSVADVGLVPVACLLVGQLVSVSASLSLCSKRDGSAPNNGFDLFANSGNVISLVVDSASGATTKTVSADHGTSAPFSVFWYRKITANELNLHTNKGNSTGGRFAETITNSDTFSVGKSTLRDSALFHFALCAMWIDEGEDFDATQLAAFNSHFGIT